MGVRVPGSRWLTVLVLAVEPTYLAHAQSQSPTYVLQQLAAASAAGAGASASFRVESTPGQEAVIGTSSSPHLVLQSGFWSFAGSGLAPVLLRLNKSPSIAGQIDLEWTGNNPPYTIYRSADCGNIFASPYFTEFSQSASDPAPLLDPLSCYKVLATAPGPIVDP